MRTAVIATSTLLAGLAGPALAGQPVTVAPPGLSLNPVIAYEIDYATSGKYATSTLAGTVDTIVSIGVPQSSTSPKCNAQVAWFDWNGTLAGISGNSSISAGITLEFTSSVNSTVPTESPPFIENVFSNITAPFEGYAQIRLDAGCAKEKLRIDAEFVTHTFPASGTTIGESYTYKPINVTVPKGVLGY